MDTLHVEAEVTALAAPWVVWELISDATRYPEWGPWSAASYRQPGETSPRGPGAIYTLRSARRAYFYYPVTVEVILEADPERRLVYTVIEGIPVRNYRGEVTLTAAGDGTRIRWTATWDSTIRGRMAYKGLREFFPRVVSGLAAAAQKNAAG